MPLLKPGRWSVNPGDIDPQYLSLWRDLVFVLNPGEAVKGEQDLHAKHIIWRDNGLVAEPTKWGMGWRASTGGSRSLTTLPLDIDSCSVLVVADWDDNGGAVQNVLIKRSAGAAGRSFYLLQNTAGTVTLGTNVSADSSVSTGTVDGPTIVVVTNDGADASAGTKFYFDGVLDSSESGVTGTDNTDLWVFGQRADNAAEDLFDGRLVLGVVWDRILSVAEIELLQLDPFGFIRHAPIFPSLLSVTLYATGDGTIADLEDEGGATTDLWASIDDDPATPNDADWINNINELSGGDASGFFEITNMPADWGNAEGGSIVVRVAGNDLASTHKLYVRLFKSDETTTLSDEVELVDVSTSSGQTNYSGTITGVSTTATKAEWDAARIKPRWSTT